MNVFIVRPIINVLLLLYQWLGHQTLLAVIVVTLMFRLSLVPLARAQIISRQKIVHKRQEIHSRLEALQEEYKNDRGKLAEEQFKLYQEAQSNPMAGCWVSLVQLPILMGVYRAIISVLAVTPIRLLALPAHIYPWLPNLSTLIPLNSRFLWLDLALRDPYLILPGLVLATSWFRNRCAMPTSGGSEKGVGGYLSIVMPLLVGFLAAGYASGLAIYLLISNLVGIAEYYIFTRHYTADSSIMDVEIDND